MDNGISSKEAERSIAASSMFPGFRFSPTDEELILYYLKKKLDGFDKCVEVITELDICKFEPWDLPAKAVIKSDQEWFFFSPRGKKYPNGSQSKRATEVGYWKATGKERAVKSGSNVIGTKRTLVFHVGRAPKGERTEWIMHEYCVAGKGQDALVVCRLRRKCDYQAITSANGELQSPTSPDPSSLMASSGTYSGGRDKEPIRLGEDKMGEGSMKKSTSSHDSHSVEQDSAAQSEWKVKDEILQPASTRHHVDNELEDDLFAEILKDSIVQLDECQPSPASGAHQPSTITSHTNGNHTTSTVPIVPRMYDTDNNHHQARVYPSQGTANRRIRLRIQRKHSPRKVELEEGFGENSNSTPNSEHSHIVSHHVQGWIRLPKDCSSLYVILISIAVFVILMVYTTDPAFSVC